MPSFMSRMYIRKTSWEQGKMKNRYDPRSKHNQWKSEHGELQRSWGGTTSQNFWSLDWLKIDLNAMNIITVQEYKSQKLMEVHIKC